MDLPVSDKTARADPPTLLARPKRQTTPLVFASAHSGRVYSPDFLTCRAWTRIGLRRSEDSFVDELFAAAPSFGAPLLAATFPRAFCDANREPWELDPAMFEDELPPWVNTASPRVGAGLGTIARVVASGEPIYRRQAPVRRSGASRPGVLGPRSMTRSPTCRRDGRPLRRVPPDRLPLHAGDQLRSRRPSFGTRGSSGRCRRPAG